MFRRVSLAPLAALALATLTFPVAAQHCAQFSVSGSGHRGTMMMLSMTGGHAYGHVFMAFSGQQGNTTFNYGPMGMLQLGLATPVMMFHMGEADANGGFHMQGQVPHHMMQRTMVFGQCLTAMIHTSHPWPPCHGQPTMHLSFCTSNVVGFGLGGHHR